MPDNDCLQELLSEANELCDKINKLCDEVLLGASAHSRQGTDAPTVVKASLSTGQDSGETIEEAGDENAAREETAEEAAGAGKERVIGGDQVENDQGRSTSETTTELVRTPGTPENTQVHASVEKGVNVGEQEKAVGSCDVADTEHADATQAPEGNEMSEEAKPVSAVDGETTSGAAAPDTQVAEVAARPKQKLNATGQVMDEKAADNMDDVLSELNKVLAEGAHLEKADVADVPAEERVRRLSETVCRH